jgi:uncharacterized protein
MDDSLPAMIDPVRLADKGARLVGHLPIASMCRLIEACPGEHGIAAIELRFGRDTEGRREMEGRIAATLHLQCQRCLGTVLTSIETRSRLFLVQSSEEEARVPPEADWLRVEGPHALSDLVEEELLLALPMMPLHEDAGCGGANEPEGEEAIMAQSNPFAVLSKLKLTDK